MNRRKIKNLLINPKYQLKYILGLFFAGAFLTGLNAAVFYYFIKENYAILVDLSPMSDQAKQQLYLELRQIVLRLSLISCGFLGLVAFIGALISHRTAGPLYHFKRIFNDIRGGKMDARVKLRPGDDFRDVADAFNEMMDTINRRGRS